MRMRESIIKEITDIIMERVKTNSYDLVFDKSGPSMNGVPVVMYSKDGADFTTDVITALNKKPVVPDKPATTTEKPATSPATTTTTTAPATTPKKP